MENKEVLQTFATNNHACVPCSSTENIKEEIETPEEAGACQLLETDTPPSRFLHQRGETQESRKFPHPRYLNEKYDLHGDPICNAKIPSFPGYLTSTAVPEKTFPLEPPMSRAPLKLQIKVSSQRGGLGISIAGGKGSLPYKDSDEGIFISRVSQGGPSEKAGIHVGDRLLEVNGLSMLEATHHEAVSALRNAGSCIRMKVLRDKVCNPDVLQDAPDSTERQVHIQSHPESTVDCFPKKIEAVVCNGNSFTDLERDLQRTMSELEAKVLKKNLLQKEKHTMSIPRIILTHPSTSDEDVELLTQIPSGDQLRDLDHPDNFVHSDCSDIVFHPPRPQQEASYAHKDSEVSHSSV